MTVANAEIDVAEPRHPVATMNPIRTHADWSAMRAAVLADPGAFHADAARKLPWFVRDIGSHGAWLRFEDGQWRGWDAFTAAAIDPGLPTDFTPWTTAFDASDAPFFKWFSGGRTNGCFAEVDVHVLTGHGDEAALIFEGDRWDMAADNGRGAPVDTYKVSRRKLLLETAKCAIALDGLGLKAGDRIALNMPSIPAQLFWTEAAKRRGIIYTPVFGGFSDKTLSDRIDDAGARVVITADGGYRNAQVFAFKTAYTDPALDNYTPVAAAKRIVSERLASLDLAAEAVSAIDAAVAATLAGETTVERSDVMRGVGRALAELSKADSGKAGTLDAAAAAKVRIAVAEALVATPPRVDHVIVCRHAPQPDLIWRSERDVWSHDLTDAASAKLCQAAGVADEAALLALPAEAFVRAIWSLAPCAPLDAEFPMFVIYTSGSTGKPKGVVHVHGGYTAGVASTMAVAFDARPGDVMYVVADPGWITGQSYMFSAALTCRVTTVMCEGAPVFPHAGRFAASIERHGVTIFKAGVTFLKFVMSDAQNLTDIGKFDLSGLRVATFCAEPTSPAVQSFGMANITPQYINSYWATEHGGIAWTHFYGNADFPLRPDAHTYPLPWIVGEVWVEDEGGASGDGIVFPRAAAGGIPHRRAEAHEKGEIVIAAPYPYLARTVWSGTGFVVENGAVVPGWRGDAARWRDGYWTRWAGAWAYTQGDFAVAHTDGSFSLHGRSDDVINVSGHRMGTEEIEGAILRDKALDPDSPVGNVLVVGAPHREKGLTPLAFVVPSPGRKLSQDDKRRLTDLVRSEKGAVAVPQDFIEVAEFPETRSGKYVRGMVRALVEGGDLGDVSTLRNPASLIALKTAIDAWQRKQKLSEEQQLFERYRYFRIQYNTVAPGKKVATVFVTNPPVNALNERALDELNIVVEHLSRRDDVVAVVFTGDGTASFVAGADIRQFLDEIHTVEEARVLPNNAQLAFNKIEAMNKPCIAAIQGVALGGGMEFALACHYRIAEPTARFGQPEIRLRLIPGYGGTQRLPRLLARANGGEGVRDALDLILGGRSIDADEAERIGLIDAIAGDSGSALEEAHALVRAHLAATASTGNHSDALGLGVARQAELVTGRETPVDADFAAILGDGHLQRIVRQTQWAGRGAACHAAVDAVRTGLTQGMTAGLAAEATAFATAVVDPAGGKAGIREFMDKRSPPLPIRRDGVFVDGEHLSRGSVLQATNQLLPVGASFFPAIDALPAYQYAFGIARDEATGAPRFGPPASHERELIVPVDRPSANDALVYMLTSEVNFNDIWALTGIPVSPFDGHENDYQTTGSGGVGLVAALGSEARAEGRLKVGDLVAVYSGTNDLLSPQVGRDPMFADFAIQGYETPTGSHAQFLTVQAPQLHSVPGDLTLEQAGSYILNLGTVWRALFTTLDIEGGKTIFVEGAATGTGHDAMKTSAKSGLSVTGLVSSPARAEYVRSEGAVGAIDRTDPRWASAFTAVPEDDVAAWEAAGEPILAEYRSLNGGKLADYAVSHAGETAFPRSFQLLGDGGVLAFYGASSGYHFTFVGKAGSVAPEAALRRARVRAGEAVLLFYGPRSTALLDETGLEMIEAARTVQARTVVVTTTDGQREFIQSLGFEDALAGVVSLEDIARREGKNFAWPDAMPRLPDAKGDIEAFRASVRDYQDKTLKPFGSAVGKLLRSPDNPRGAPDLVLERAGQDTLGVTTALVKPFTGRVVYAEDMAHKRYSFYAPQVWTRQRRIVMPTAEIRGTHLCNSYEVTRMNDMIAAGLLEVTEPTMVPWADLPAAHQAMWDNRHTGATYVVNHALPEPGLRGKDALLEAWAARDAADGGQNK